MGSVSTRVGRFRVLALSGFFMLAAAALVGPPAQAYVYGQSCCQYVRFDMKGTDFLWGNLTYQNGQGRIVWGPSTPSNTDAVGGGGTPDDVQKALLQYDPNTRYYAGQRLQALPAPDEFVSDPIPQRLFLNVSRSMSLELQLKKNPAFTGASGCASYYQSYVEPELDVELWMGDKLLGGSYGYNYIYWPHASPTGVHPSSPSGFDTCYFGMSPEAMILEQGAVLKLKVIHVEQNYYFPYGFGPDHPSVIRIPLYPLEEIIFRYPPEVSGVQPAEDGNQEAEVPGRVEMRRVDAGPLSGAAGLAALVGITRVRLGGRGTLVVAAGLLLVAALGGCIGSKSKDGEAPSDSLRGQGQVTQIAQGPGGLGSVIGEVYDDIHVPLGDVHVSIIGFPNFTKTDGQGRFKFVGLVPGLYKLRFDKLTYSSFELDVHVKAGFIAKPSVMMFLANAKDRDYRPHNHDYWTGQASPKTLMDQVVANTCYMTYNAYQYCYVTQPVRLAPKGDDPMIVPPGTSEVEVTFNWNPEEMGGIDMLGLAVKPGQGGLNYSMYAPRPSGVPFRIQNTWEMSDRGHSPYSNWLFYYITPHRDAQTIGETYQYYYTPPAPIDKLEVKVVIRRGQNIPLEPPHPDPWGDKVNLPIQSSAPVYISGSLYPPESPLWAATAAKGSCPVPKAIPQGTRWVEVTLKQSRRTQPSYEWDLYYKPANVPYHVANYGTWQGFKTYARATPNDGEKTVWKVPIKDDEADFMYGKTSTWYVYFTPADKQSWWLDYETSLTALALTCTITAHKTPP